MSNATASCFFETTFTNFFWNTLPIAVKRAEQSWTGRILSFFVNFFDYDSINARPSLKHIFGVDPIGRDIFSRILMGARISLTAGFVSVATWLLLESNSVNVTWSVGWKAWLAPGSGVKVAVNVTSWP